MPTPAPSPAPTGATPRWILPAVPAAGLLIAVSFGPGDPLLARLGALLSAAVFSGWTPAAYLLAAVGWGTLARPWTRPIPGAPAIDAGVGLAAILSVTHALGVLGLLNPITAWAWTGVGLILLARAHAPALRTLAARSVPGTRGSAAVLLTASVGLCVMLVAAASPPGALWDSEFGAYDTLSYHLQLPAEWLENGRIAPLDHNVYAFLPGYMEAAAVHLAHLAAAPATTATGLSAFATPDLATAAHFLALGVTLIAAWATASFTGVLVARAAPDATDTTARLAAYAAGSLVLLTPWAQVVGSIAYNEPGVIALGAAGLLAAIAPGLTPARRGVLVAVLIGGATGCKPTAVLFLAPAGAILMAVATPGRSWARAFGVGAAVGLLTLAPWLARNAAHAGNPVFPHATALLGAAHWTPEQADRYAAGHRFEGSVTDRVALLALPDDAPDPAPAVVRWRGLTNPQWALTPWLGLAGCLLALAAPRARPTGLALLGGIGAACVAWAAFTHLQSRFLIPLLPLFGAGFGVGLAATPLTLRTPIALSALAVSALWSMGNLATQRAGQPNALLVVGPGIFSGQLAIEGLGDEVAWAGVNETVPAGDTVLLVGDATPLYLRRPLAYATTWDTNPLAAAARQDPDDPAAWTRTLRASGLEWALVSFAELDRLAASGWADPALSPDRVAEWCGTLGPPARVWPSQGRALFRLRSPAP